MDGLKGRITESDEALREMVASGMKLKEMAFLFGVTHQAISLRLKKAGITIPPRPKKSDQPKISGKYGMPMEKVHWLQSIGATRAFTYQKNNAKHRGIGWLLTFREWWGLWEASGVWEKRGREKGGYVMGRHGDIGPYAMGNVVICTHKENVAVRESHSPSSFKWQKNSINGMDAGV